MLEKLPAEVILLILATLSISSIHSLRLTSKTWNNFLQTNEDTVYHAAAVVHGYIDSTSEGFDRLPCLYSSRITAGLRENWKTFCRRRTQLEKSWKGLAPSRLAKYPASGKSVHRIKVDEVHGFIITSYTSRTFGTMGLLVSDMNKDRSYIKEYAHIEYQTEYLIFDRLGGRKEVWRLATISDPSPPTQSQLPPPPPYPQQNQLTASLAAAAEYAHTYPHGHFVPHALLQFPRPTRAFRFIYPTLLVGGWDEAYCWDVPTRTLVQTISGTQEPTVPVNSSEEEGESIVLDPLGEINYVEVSAKHVFICGSNTLRIFDRQTSACVLDMPSTRRYYGSRVVKVPGDAEGIATEEQGPPSFAALFDKQRSWKQVGVKEESVVSRLHSARLDPTPEDHRRAHDEFVAVHVSPCGSHFVAMLCSSSLVIVQDFPMMDRDALFERSIQVVLGTQNSPAKYLAYDRGKVAVASTTGIFILDINDFIP
ncbi:hypothetical protein MPER_11000, partial [Moniliophthora perniciosa FA553]